jgi:hypothetical protein
LSLTGNNGLLASAGANQPAYSIDESLRFEDGDSAYLSRTAGSSASDTRKWTYSGWVKFANTDTGYVLFMGGPSVNDNSTIKTSGSIIMLENHTDPSTSTFKIKTSRVIRDFAAWYHIFVAYDSTQGVEADRIKLYVNGERVTSFSEAAYPSLNTTEPYINVNTKNQMLSRYGSNDTGYYDGYMAEVHVIDGTASVGDFGETDAATNQWVPIEYTGSYGTNGFYLKFVSGAIGTDSSGNGNTFTATNLSATTDVVIDTPTNNYCTLNSLNNRGTLKEGNLEIDISTSNMFGSSSTIAEDSGKWYAEFYLGAFSSSAVFMPGITGDPAEDNRNNNYLGASATAWGYDTSTGSVYNNSSAVSYGNTATTGDIIGVAMDLENNKLYFSKNGTWQNSGVPTSGATGTGAASLTAGETYAFAVSDGSAAHSTTTIVNFGSDSSFAGAVTAQGNGGDGEDFYYTPPTGYKALNTDNLSDPAIALPTDHFNTATYAGTGASQTIAVGFQPDFVWAKSRNTAVNHVLYDSVRGTGRLESNNANAEGTRDGFAGYSSNGFDVDSDGGGGGINYPSGRTYVAWNWKAGGTASSNTDGSITSSVSATTTAGFSIVSYTGNGTSPSTIGHGLSVAPEMVMVKNRTTAAENWVVSVGNVTGTNGDFLILNLTSAVIAGTSQFSSQPGSSVFTVTDAANVNTNTSNYIAYCFHSVEGYSKVGSYTGNGVNDGTFVYTGFRPMWVMAKCSDGSASWLMTDSVRFPYNVTDDPLFANETSAETNSSTYAIDILSNGFKCRGVNNDTNNSSGNVYIYLAFAESPFKTSNAR